MRKFQASGSCRHVLMNGRYAWGRQGADTFYTKISPIYINLENLLSDEIPGFNAVRLRSETTRLPKL